MAKADAQAVVHLDEAYCARLVPRRDPNGHKGTFGTVVCVSGSLDYAGAALLCASSAARSGAGLVTLAVPRSLQRLFAGRVPEVTTFGLEETAEGTDIDPAAAGHAFKTLGADSMVIGPGLAELEGYRELVVRLVARSGPPMVVDGGALNMLARSGNWWTGAQRDCVLTPHPTEFERITGRPVTADDDQRRERCVEAAARFGQVVVLKGARTVIASPAGQICVAPFANPALATAGSGDVLAGLIGALLAQGMAPFDGACLGVFMHGMAGDRINQRLGDAGLLASDLPYEIAVVRHDLARRRDA